MTILGAKSVLPHCSRQDPLVWGAIYKLQPSLGVSLAFGAIYVLQTSQPVSLQTLVSLPPILHIGEEGQQRCVLLSQPFSGFEGLEFQSTPSHNKCFMYQAISSALEYAFLR